MKLIEYLKVGAKYFPWACLIVGAVLFVRQCNEPPEVEYVPVEVEVLVPSVEKEFDTIYEPKPVPVIVREIDSTYYEKYKQLKDSVAKDSMFKDAIAIREYNEKFEDTLQTIDVYSKTRGSLLEQNVKYTTKPYYITVKDSIEIKEKFSVSVGAEVGVPILGNQLNPTPVLKGNIIIGKRNPIIISGDTEGRVWVGKVWKLRFRKR